VSSLFCFHGRFLEFRRDEMLMLENKMEAACGSAYKATGELFTAPRLIWLGLVLMFSTMFSPALVAESFQGGMAFLEVDVQVRYQDGSAGPAGMHVLLENAVGGMETDCQTREGGTCRLQPSRTGIYTVSLNQNGYAEVSQRVELVGILHAYVTLTLRKLNDDTGTSAGKDAPGDKVDVGDMNIPEPARREFVKGEQALSEKKVQESAKHFQKATKLYEEYPQAYRMLGDAYLEMKEWKKAEVALKRSIELEPKLAAAYVDLGAVYNQTQNFPAAEQALKRGLELSPDAAAAKYELAKTYWGMGRWQDAMPLAQDAVSALPKLAAAHVLLGNIDLKKRDASGALREYEEYLRLEPEGPMAPEVRKMVAKLRNGLAK
jgi:Tfp pilus assembly protein PilF